MNHNHYLPESNLEPRHVKPTEHLTVVVAYDHALAGRSARRLVDRLASVLHGDYTIQLKLWRFDVLGLPEIRVAANADAVAADVVVVAFSQPAPQSPVLTRWLTEWARARGERAAALVAFAASAPAGDGTRPSFTLELRQLASEHGLTFLDSRDEEMNECWQAGLERSTPWEPSPATAAWPCGTAGRAAA